MGEAGVWVNGVIFLAQVINAASPYSFHAVSTKSFGLIPDLIIFALRPLHDNIYLLNGLKGK